MDSLSMEEVCCISNDDIEEIRKNLLCISDVRASTHLDGTIGAFRERWAYLGTCHPSAVPAAVAPLIKLLQKRSECLDAFIEALERSAAEALDASSEFLVLAFGRIIVEVIGLRVRAAPTLANTGDLVVVIMRQALLEAIGWGTGAEDYYWKRGTRLIDDTVRRYGVEFASSVLASWYYEYGSALLERGLLVPAERHLEAAQNSVRAGLEAAGDEGTVMYLQTIRDAAEVKRATLACRAGKWRAGVAALMCVLPRLNNVLRIADGDELITEMASEAVDEAHVFLHAPSVNRCATRSPRTLCELDEQREYGGDCSRLRPGFKPWVERRVK